MPKTRPRIKTPPNLPPPAPKKVTVALAHPSEVWAVLRALALAAESPKTFANDRGPIQWVSERLLLIVHEINNTEGS